MEVGAVIGQVGFGFDVEFYGQVFDLFVGVVIEEEDHAFFEGHGEAAVGFGVGGADEQAVEVAGIGNGLIGRFFISDGGEGGEGFVVAGVGVAEEVADGDIDAGIDGLIPVDAQAEVLQDFGGGRVNGKTDLSDDTGAGVSDAFHFAGSEARESFFDGP